MPKAQTSVAVVIWGIVSSSSPLEGVINSYAIHRQVPQTDFVVKPDSPKTRERPKSVMHASHSSFTRIFDWSDQVGKHQDMRKRLTSAYCFHVAVDDFAMMQICQAGSDLRHLHYHIRYHSSSFKCIGSSQVSSCRHRDSFRDILPHFHSWSKGKSDTVWIVGLNQRRCRRMVWCWDDRADSRLVPPVAISEETSKCNVRILVAVKTEIHFF